MLPPAGLKNSYQSPLNDVTGKRDLRMSDI